MSVDITEHLALVGWRVDRRWSGAIGGRIERDDLISQGYVGLLKAAARFDPSRGTTFPTYAVWWIDSLVRRHIQAHSRLVRLPIAEPATEALKAKRVPERVTYIDAQVAGLDSTSSHDLLGHDDPAQEQAAAKRDVARLLLRIRDERTRAIVTAYYIDGLTMDEIGQPLGIGRERVRQLLLEGLRVMRVNLLKARWAERRAPDRDVA